MAFYERLDILHQTNFKQDSSYPAGPIIMRKYNIHTLVSAAPIASVRVSSRVSLSDNHSDSSSSFRKWVDLALNVFFFILVDILGKLSVSNILPVAVSSFFFLVGDS